MATRRARRKSKAWKTTSTLSLMNLLSLVGFHTRENTSPSPSPAILPPPRTPSYGLDSFLGLDAVFRALSYLQTITGQLSIDAWKNGVPTRHPLVEKPDQYSSVRAWVIANVAALSTSGNAFWKITRDAKDQILNIEVIDPARVQVAQDDTYRIHYQVDGKAVPPAQIAHLRYLTLPGRPLGMGPIQAARQSLTGMVQLSRYADDLFTRGGTPNGILKSKNPLTEEQAQAARAKWTESVNSGKVAVMDMNLDWTPAGTAPADLQWLESQQWNVTRIARLFGIPAHKLAAGIEGASLTYQNIEQSALDAMRDTIMGYLAPIEDALSGLLPRGTYARFNLDAVLRPDTKTRYEAHEIALRAGFLTVDEVREIEGRKPLNGNHE